MKIFTPFKKENNDIPMCGHVQYNYQIKYNTTSPTKHYDINNDEGKFINELFLKCENVGLSAEKFSFTRMLNGTISAFYISSPHQQILFSPLNFAVDFVIITKLHFN